MRASAASPFGDRCTLCVDRFDNLFCNLSDQALAELDEIKFPMSYRAGALLFLEGEAPRGVFILCRGKVKLTMSSPSGKILIAQIAEPGALLGANDVLGDTASDFTAETLESSQITVIWRDDFLRFLQNHPDACRQTALDLTEKNRAAKLDRARIDAFHSALPNVARLLYDWAQRDGQETPGGVRLPVLVTHGEIGQLTGTTRELVTAALVELRLRGILDVRGTNYFILTMDGLGEAAQLPLRDQVLLSRR